MGEPVGEVSSADQPVVITRKSVATSALWSSGATLLSVPLLAVTTILLARVLASEAFGRYALYTLLTALISGVFDLGIGTTILRRGALAAGVGDEAATLSAVRAGTTWSLVQLPLNVAMGFLVLPTTVDGSLYALSVVLSFGVLGPSHYLVMTNQLRIPSLLRLATLPITAASMLVTAYATHRADLTFCAASLAPSVLTVGQVVAVPGRLRRAVFLPGRLGISRSDLSFGVGNFINSQLNSFLFSKSEILFFRAAKVQARGRFAASQSVAARATVVPDALLGNLPYGLVNAFGRGQDFLGKTFAVVCDAVALLFTVIGPITLAGMAVLTEPVLGHSYHGIAGPTVILGVMSLLQTSASPLLSAWFAQKMIRPLIVAGVVGAVVDAIAAAILVPTYGIVGAIVASAAGSGSYLVCAVVQFREQAVIRKIGVGHMVRMTAIVVYGAAPAMCLLFVPWQIGLALLLPVTVLWTIIGVRLRPLRVESPGTLNALLESLPSPLARAMGSRPTRWLLSQQN